MTNPLQILINSPEILLWSLGVIHFSLLRRPQTKSWLNDSPRWMSQERVRKLSWVLKLGWEKFITCSKKLPDRVQSELFTEAVRVEQTELMRFGLKGFRVRIIRENQKDSLVYNHSTPHPPPPRTIWLEKTEMHSTSPLETQFKVMMLLVMLKWKEGQAVWGFFVGLVQVLCGVERGF